MHGLAQEIVATERERKVADATADVRSRKVSTYPSRGTDKVKCIGAVLGKSRTDGKYVGIEDDILRPDACFLRQKSIGTLAGVRTKWPVPLRRRPSQLLRLQATSIPGHG